MKKATKIAYFNILGSLRDFAGTTSDNPLMKVNFELSPSVKDLLEGRGIPHTAVFKLKVNNIPRKMDYNVDDGDKIKVYPFELARVDEYDPIFSTPSSFVADAHLRKLAKTLRLLGLDTTYSREWDNHELISHSNRERRMILTRDLELLKHSSTVFGYWIRSTDPDIQVEEVFKRFNIEEKLQPFSRCMECNGLLETVAKEKVEDKVPPKVKEWHSTFYQCRNCKKVYWKGSHYKKLEQKVAKLRRQI